VNASESDKLINTILKGDTPDLRRLEKLTLDNTDILGCTELSVACRHMSANFVDPVELAALDIMQKFIERNR